MDDETYGLIDEPNEAFVEDAPAGPLGEDLPCRHCGYNLRGLTVERACPECGTAVARSLLDDRLRYSDPVWVRTLARGATWILISVLLGIALAVAGFVVQMVAVSRNAGNPVGQPTLLQNVMNVISVVPSVVYLVGVWFITAPEPSMTESAEWNVRSVLRWAVVLSTVVSFLSMGVLVAAPLSAGAVGVVSIIVGTVAYILLFVYARRLALRVPDYELAKQTKIVMWGMIIIFAGFILSGILAVVAVTAGAGAGAMLVGIPFCALGVAYLVFAIWSLILLIRYRRVANEAALEAEQSWAREV